MQGEYSDYNYKRYRRPRAFFPYIIIALLLGIIFFTANLFFGFIKLTKAESGLVLPEYSFWAAQSKTLATKAAAIDYSSETRVRGGAGHILADKNFVVIEQVFANAEPDTTQYDLQKIKIPLQSADHRGLLRDLTEFFWTNFSILCAQHNDFIAERLTAREIADAALVSYNSLNELISQLDKIQERTQSTAYANILLQANNAALNLLILSMEAANTDFAQCIKSASCGIIFAYRELVGKFV